MCSMPPKPMADELPEEYLYYAICVTGITALLVIVYFWLPFIIGISVRKTRNNHKTGCLNYYKALFCG